jgi:hypothetical protein
MLAMIQDTLLPLVEGVCTNIAAKADNIPLGKTFTNTSGQSVRIVLTKPQWNRFKGYFTISQDIAAKTVEATRNKAVCNPARRDTIHKGFYTYWPALRVWTSSETMACFCPTELVEWASTCRTQPSSRSSGSGP